MPPLEALQRVLEQHLPVDTQRLERAALTAALVIPTRGAAIGEAFGTVLLVRALAAIAETTTEATERRDEWRRVASERI